MQLNPVLFIYNKLLSSKWLHPIPLTGSHFTLRQHFLFSCCPLWCTTELPLRPCNIFTVHVCLMDYDMDIAIYSI